MAQKKRKPTKFKKQRRSVTMKIVKAMTKRTTRARQRLLLFLPLCFILLLILYLTSSGSGRGQGRQHRIAIVIPFIGKGPESIPPYLDLFCTAAGGSASLVDFLIIHNGALEQYGNLSKEQGSRNYIPNNVKFINLGSTEEMAKLLSRVVVDRSEGSPLSFEKQVNIVQHHLDKYPYALVEYKPAFGHIFADFLTEYTHWGYSDLDIAFGDLPRWITNEELTDFDIVTYGYGDQNRVYLRGQFTFHRNDNERVNQIWRECKYLSELDKRYVKVLSGKEKMRFESAEGCYSSAVLQQKDIKVKYAVKAFTDADEEEDSAGTNVHGLFLYADRYGTVIYRPAKKDDGRDTLMLSPKEWYTSITSTNTPFQWEVGTLEPIERESGSKCMYWVREKYQADICVSDVDATDTVFLINGELHKQSYQNLPLPSNTLTVPFFHFQEWKRYYRTSQNANVHLPEEGSMHWALTKEGAIPLSPLISEMTHGARTISSPLGIQPSEWKGLVDQLPRTPYCLRSARKKYPSNPVVTECKDVIYWQDTEAVEIIQFAPQWKYVNVNLDVTVALTLQISAEQASNKVALESALDDAVSSMKSWRNQPCVLVIHVAGATDESESIIKNRLTDPSLHTDASYSPEVCLIAAIFDDETTELVSRNALLNMATDVSPTRWVVSGLEVERGLIFAEEASFLARRMAKIHENLPGRAFVIPEIDIEGDDEPYRKNPSLNTILRTKEGPATIETIRGTFRETDDMVEHSRLVNSIWRKRTLQQLSGEHPHEDDTSLLEYATTSNKIHLSLNKFLLSDELITAVLPSVVMTDNIGPREGLRTTTLVREVEEFGGASCFDGLRLAQLAVFGYHVDPLPGVFVAPGISSKYSPCEQSSNPKCPIGHECFMFEGETTLLASIANDEIARPIKSAILWNELDSQSWK